MVSKVKKNFIYNSVYQILLVLLPIITTPYISRVLGKDGVGTYSFTYSIVLYFVLFGTLGVAAYGRREIAYLQNDRKKRSETFWQINLIKWIAMSISILVFYFVFAHTGELSLYYKIFAIELFSSMIDITWYFQGLEQFKTIAIRNIIIKLTSVAAIFLFVKQPTDLWLYIVIFCVSNFLSNVVLWILLPRTIQKTKLTLAGTKKHLPPILMMFLPQITIEVYTVLDKTMIGLIVQDMGEVGIYEQSQKVEKISLNVISALGPVMAARVSSLLADNKKEEAIATLKKAFHFIWLLATPIALGIIAISTNLVPWFLGDAFMKAVPIMQIGAILIFAIALSNVTGHQYLIPMRKQKIFTSSVVAGAISNFTLNLALIPWLGAIGAIIASVTSECVVTAVQLYFIRRDIPLKDIFKPALKILPCGIVMFLAVYFAGFMLPKTVLGTFIQVCIGGLVYFIMSVITRDSFVMEGIDSIFKRLHRDTKK